MVPGQSYYRFFGAAEDKVKAKLCVATYVHQRGSWHRWSNNSGFEWNENGMRWYVSPEAAVIEVIRFYDTDSAVEAFKFYVAHRNGETKFIKAKAILQALGD